MTIRIGDGGMAVSSLHPQGLVQIYGRRYHARAEHGAIASGANVLVVGGNHLGLVVRESAGVGLAAGLPGYGQPIHVNYLDRMAETGEHDEAAERALQKVRLRRGLAWSAAAGAAVGVCVLSIVWDSIAADSGPLVVAIGVALVAGAVWAAAAFWVLFEAMDRFDRGTGYITATCTGLAIAGGAGGAAVGIPAFGLAGGLSLALIGTVALGLALPLLLVAGNNAGQ